MKALPFGTELPTFQLADRFPSLPNHAKAATSQIPTPTGHCPPEIATQFPSMAAFPPYGERRYKIPASTPAQPQPPQPAP